MNTLEQDLQGTSGAFKNEKYVTKPRDGALIELIDNIGKVSEDNLPQESTILCSIQVIGVRSITSCYACNAKVHEIQDSWLHAPNVV